MGKTYKGRLASPLPPPPGLLTSDDYKADRAAYEKEVKERIYLLFDHYEIKPSDRASWAKLARALAAHHVPGLKPFKPQGNPDRKAKILFRMLYSLKSCGLSEHQAAQRISELWPELGKPDAIRSCYREIEFHPTEKHLLEFFCRLERDIGAKVFREALRDAIGDSVDDLDSTTPVKRGRPRKE